MTFARMFTAKMVGSRNGPMAQASDLAPSFGDLSQSEKLSEIKPPLGHTIRKCSKMDGQKYIPFFAFK